MTGTETFPVLVTGATGFIGGRLAERLVAAGRPVRALVRDPGRLRPSLRGRVETVTGALGDPAAMAAAVRGAGLVFHCAANAATWDRPEAYERTNVTGVRVLLEALAGQGRPPRLVHLSTVDVYGYPAAPCDETAPTGGGGFGYGESKLRGEALVRALAGPAGIPFTILRPANVIGPGSQFVARIGAALRSGLMLTVDGGRANAGLIFVDNLVGDLLWAAAAPQALGRCYNLRDPYDATWAEFVDRFRRRIGGRGMVVDLPFAVADAAAHALAAAHRVLRLPGEPLLHPLLVRMFGRSCGHSAERIRRDAAAAGVGRVGFEEAMEASARWFLEASGAADGGGVHPG